MVKRDLTVEILKDIRTEIRSTREDLSKRIDQTNARLDHTNEHLHGAVGRIDLLVEGQVRLATEVVAVASSVQQLTEALREDRALRSTVDDHDKRIARLERRVG
jgi:uncharacterized protein YPO0396